jgi:hypothetical protein
VACGSIYMIGPLRARLLAAGATPLQAAEDADGAEG